MEIAKTTVLGIHYAISDVDRGTRYVEEHIDELRGKYLCFSNVHTTVMANGDASYMECLQEATIVFPDGAPIAREMRKQGFDDACRVAGPDFMAKTFERTVGTGLRHFFMGSTSETLEKLKDNLEKKYPGILIAGMISPPFHPMTEEEDEQIIKMLQDTKADYIWIGLGAPKQEKWMKQHAGLFTGVMLGVGAGFDFHAGTVKRAPIWMQKIGMEWFYRLTQDPKRLFKRYITTNWAYLRMLQESKREHK